MEFVHIYSAENLLSMISVELQIVIVDAVPTDPEIVVGFTYIYPP